MQKNLNVLERETVDVKVKVDAVVSSVIIAYVFMQYNVYVESEENEILLKCLKIPPDQETCSEFMKSVKKFDEKTLR
jgi:hypothetical protein